MMRQTRICFVCDDLLKGLDQRNPSASYFLGLSKHINLSGADSAAFRIHQDQHKIRGIARFPVASEDFPRILKVVFYPIPEWMFVRRFCSDSWNREFDLYHLYGPKIMKLGVPFVVSIDSTYRTSAELGYPYRGPRLELLSRLMKRNLQQAIFVNPFTRFAAERIIEEFTISPTRVHVIPPGVDTDRFKPRRETSSETVNALFVGSEFRRKGGEILLEALSRIPEEKHLRLTIVSRDFTPSVKGRIRFLGSVPYGQLLQTFASSDIFIVPGTAEAYGFAQLEAMASGLASVAPDHPLRREIAEDSAVYFKSGESSDLAEKLMQLADDVVRIRSLGKIARNIVESRHRWDIVSKQISDLYDDALEEARA